MQKPGPVHLCIFPEPPAGGREGGREGRLTGMRKVSRAVAKRVALQAVKDGVASDVTPGESEHSILARVDASFWEPVYPEVRLSK